MKRKVIHTILTMLVIMTFYFMAGAAVVTRNLTGSEAKITQGIFIWLSVIAAVVFSLCKYKAISVLGMNKIRKGSLKELLYLIPMIIVALLGLIAGIDFSQGAEFLFASLFLTIGVGFSEEIYFRGIICTIWKAQGNKIAVIVSSVLFGICHLMNVLGGANVGATILQIFFAFFYGIIFAIIFVNTNSLLPCVGLHFLHDFCAFIGNDISDRAEIGLIVTQTVIMFAYMAILLKRNLLAENKDLAMSNES